MNSRVHSNLAYNELEYFCYLNHWLLFLFFFIGAFYAALKITALYFYKIYYNDTFIEFVCTLFSLLFLLLIVSPALIILLDTDSITMPSFIIYSLGYQWAWTYSISYLHSNIGYTSYHDHYIMSSCFWISGWRALHVLIVADNINSRLIQSGASAAAPIINSAADLPILALAAAAGLYIICAAALHICRSLALCSFRLPLPAELVFYILRHSAAALLPIARCPLLNKGSCCFQLQPHNYLFEANQYLVIPLWSCVKIYCFSLDVIHSLSFYSFGFKADVIPGRINLTSSLRSLAKGVNRGFCYELCGEQHNTMLNSWLLL